MKELARGALDDALARRRVDDLGAAAHVDEMLSAAAHDGVTIELVSPKAPTPGFHNHSVAQTALAASSVPKSARASG